MNGTEIVAIQQRSLTPEVNDLRTLNRQLSHFFCHPNFSATAGICIICTESHPPRIARVCMWLLMMRVGGWGFGQERKDWRGLRQQTEHNEGGTAFINMYGHLSRFIHGATIA